MNIKFSKFKKWSAVICTGCAILCTHSAIAKTKAGGWFQAFNDTDRAITITVGNYFPTSYTIDAHSSHIIWVTTDNQNIHIKQIH